MLPLTVLACAGGDAAPVGTEQYFPLAYGDRPTVEQLSALGRKIFFDASLSASGRQSCASCHSPAHAYGPPNALPVQPGGESLSRMGFRNTPALRYLHSPVAFTEHFMESQVYGGADDEGPAGGRTWDGRVDSGHAQALMPLLDANEMANDSVQQIGERLRRSAYADEFQRITSPDGENIFDTPDAAVGWMAVALEAFESSPAEFHPFTSKYDAYLRDEVQLSPQEQRGLALFNDIKKGNCVSCHPGANRNPPDRMPLFTDFGYVALGAPRNSAIPANRDAAFHDLGLCGPLRKDLADKAEYCGRFRTPTLRNAALRSSFFHNGVFHSLKEVVEFYATRDTDPARWYPRDARGHVDKFDDLPEAYRANVKLDPPFKPLPGNRPRLNAAEIDDIVAFLKTLTDGYRRP